MAALGSWGLFVYTEFMDIELDPKDERLLETLSSESGKPVGVLLRELLHEALTSKKANGKQQLGSQEPVTWSFTCTGDKRLVVVPSPSCPALLLPHVQTVP